MAMSLVGSLHLVDTIGVHEAHHRSHGEQTRHQCGQYLPGFEGRHNQHGHFTPSATALLQPRSPLPGR